VVTTIKPEPSVKRAAKMNMICAPVIGKPLGNL
jgi:hypothetical protein